MPTAADIAACGDMTPDTRRRWVDVHGLLGPGPFTEYDAIETAIAALLTQRTSPQRACASFKALRSQLRQLVMAGERDLWIVVARKLDVSLARGAEEAAAIADQLAAPAWLISLSPAIALARSRYQRCVASGPGNVRPLIARDAAGD